MGRRYQLCESDSAKEARYVISVDGIDKVQFMYLTEGKTPGTLKLGKFSRRQVDDYVEMIEAYEASDLKRQVEIFSPAGTKTLRTRGASLSSPPLTKPLNSKAKVSSSTKSKRGASPSAESTPDSRKERLAEPPESGAKVSPTVNPGAPALAQPTPALEILQKSFVAGIATKFKVTIPQDIADNVDM